MIVTPHTPRLIAYATLIAVMLPMLPLAMARDWQGVAAYYALTCATV